MNKVLYYYFYFTQIMIDFYIVIKTINQSIFVNHDEYWRRRCAEIEQQLNIENIVCVFDLLEIEIMNNHYNI